MFFKSNKSLGLTQDEVVVEDAVSPNDSQYIGSPFSFPFLGFYYSARLGPDMASYSCTF